MRRIDDLAGSEVPERTRATRLFVMCCIVSAVLHGALLLINGQPPTGSVHVGGDTLRLRVALAPGSAGEVVEQTSPYPLPLLPKTDPARLYPHLLDFAPVALPPPKFEEAAYLPLSKLSVPPTAAREIRIAYPESASQAELLIASLTLFINEDGSVAEVRAEAPHAPPAYEHAAVEAFSKARFNPGKVGTAAVKARMVIRVAFDSGAGLAARSSLGIKFR